MPDTGHLWVRLTEAGCAYNALPATAAASAEEAHRRITPDPKERDGFHVELYTRQQWQQQGARCFQFRCTHSAKEAA